MLTSKILGNNDAISENNRTLKDIENGYVYCYVVNADDDFCSEFGTCIFKNRNGSLIRVA